MSRPMLLVHAALAVLLLHPVSGALDSVAAQDSATASRDRALAVARAGMDALGGADAWTRTSDLLVEFEGETIHRHQSRRPGPPYDRTPLRGRVAWDNAGGRFAYLQSSGYPGGFHIRFGAITDGRAAYRLNYVARTAEPLPQADAAQFVALRDRMPQALLQRVIESGTLRYAGRRTLQGRPHDVVTFTAAGGNVLTLLFDAETALLRAYEMPMLDATDGDVAIGVEFGDYRRAGELVVPGMRSLVMGGERRDSVRYEVTVGRALPDSLFALPDGFALDTVVASPRAVTPRLLAPGVHAIQGVAGSTVLAVEFADHLMVVEPLGRDAESRRVLDTLAHIAPGKRVRYVVATHFHDDHAGGVRAYMEAGATVITTPAYRGWFERVARRAGTIGGPDRPIAAPKIEVVRGGRRVFEDSTRRVELLDIGRNPHTDEMVVVWLPEERILFQGDLWNPPWGDAGAPRRGNATTEYFVEWLERSDLNPETIVGVHGPIQTRAELEAAVAHLRSSSETRLRRSGSAATRRGE